MRALRYEGRTKGVALSSTAPDPALIEGEALVRPLRMMIGAADLALLSRSPDLPPITMGREFVGIVEKVAATKTAKDKSNALVGKRVVASPDIACGECDLCQRGLAGHCRNRLVVGLAGRDGCFADRIAMPIRNLFVVPAELDDDRAVFAETLASAVHAVQQIRIEGQPYITIIGDGAMGLLCGQLMNRLNAAVRIIGNHESRLDMSAKWGVKHRLERDVGRRADQDVVIDCTGTPEGFDLALRFVRPRGKILHKGAIHPALAAPWTLDLGPIATKEVEVIGSRCGPIGEALEVLRRGEIDVISLISKRARLADGVEALHAAARGDVIKCVLDP